MQSRQQTREHYFAIITAWKLSGQKQFCLQNNIAYHVFHYWYKVYRDQPSATGSFVALNLAAAQQSGIELHLTDGRRLVFYQPVSADFLRALIA